MHLFFFKPLMIAGSLLIALGGSYFLGRIDSSQACKNRLLKIRVEQQEQFEKSRLDLEEKNKALNIQFSEKLQKRERQISRLDDKFQKYLNTPSRNVCAIDAEGVRLINSYAGFDEAPSP